MNEQQSLEQSLDRALDRYMAHNARALALANELTLYLEDHGEVAPEDVTWANVGDMSRIVSDLTDIMEYVRGEGE